MSEYLYSAFGLTITSALPLLGMAPGTGEADVLIDVTQRTDTGDCSPAPIRCVSSSPMRHHLTWSGVGDLRIEGGRRIALERHPSADDDALRLFILGAGLGVLLHLRGLLVLHASCVAIGGGAVGLVGAKGFGKSTAAAALCHRGHALVSDELLVLRQKAKGEPQALRGWSQIRLWGDALPVIGRNPAAAPPVRKGVTKYYVDVKSVEQSELPLRRLYVLGVGDETRLVPLAPNAAMLALRPHLYVERFSPSFLRGTDAKNSFLAMADLLRSAPVKCLVRRPGLEALPAIVDVIERDLRDGSADLAD